MNGSTGNDFPIDGRMAFSNEENNENEALLTLSLSTTSNNHHHHPPPLTLPPIHHAPPQQHPQQEPPFPLLHSAPPLFIPPPPPPAARRPRRRPSTSPREGKSPTVPPPYPWATNRRATVHSLKDLLDKQIYSISGDVWCKRCERVDRVELDLREKFAEIGSYVSKNKDLLCDRAPPGWSNPVLLTCRFCHQENSGKPVVANKKRNINWLFLLLSQTLGLCNLNELKYFCKHTRNHRTGAKDRVLYLAYLALCKQLDPNGPFNR